MILTVYLEATPRFELGNQGFADPCLTTWLYVQTNNAIISYYIFKN